MPPRKSRPVKKQKRGLPTWVIIAGAAVVVLIVLGIAIGTLNSAPPTPVATSITSGGIPSQGRTLGNANAPITLVDYSDFQ